MFYGLQENEKHKMVKKIYEKLENRINEKRRNNEAIIGGDFKAKVAITWTPDILP